MSNNRKQTKPETNKTVRTNKVQEEIKSNKPWMIGFEWLVSW